MEGKKKDKNNPARTDIYSQLAEERPERTIEEIEEGRAKTLSEKAEEAPSLTDMQAALLRLFPEGLGGQVANSAMIARIAPDVFLDLLYLMTESDVFTSDPDKPIDVPLLALKNYTLLSIGLDGKGRIDQIELAGASKESDELEKLGKELF